MGNTILVIGNGFDLYHRLPTRYTDFLTFAEHWDTFKEIYDSYRDSNGQVVRKTTATEALFEIRMDEYGKLTQESVKDLANHAHYYYYASVQFLDENIQSNAWIQYFMSIGYKEDGWIDFEREMEKVLLTVEDYYSALPSCVGTCPDEIVSQRIINIIKRFGAKARPPYRDISSTSLSVEDIEEDKLRSQKIALLESMKIEMTLLNQCLYIYLYEFVNRIKTTLYSE